MTTTTTTTVKFNALLFKRGDWWVAQGIEYDIVAQAKTIEDLDYEFQRAIVAEMIIAVKHGEEPFANLSPAPEVYYDLWQDAVALREREPKLFRSPALQRPVVLAEPEYRIAS